MNMPVGGCASPHWLFDPASGGSNEENTLHWSDAATAATYAEEGTIQGPGGGLDLIGLPSTHVKGYMASVAIGSRNLEVLAGGGPMATTLAIIERFAAFAAADGHELDYVFVYHHGEKAVSDATSEAQYYANGMDYCTALQLYAAQAVGRPSYVPPILFAHHMQMQPVIANAVGIQKAILRLSEDVPNAMSIGPSYPYDSESDRIHQTPLGFVQRGEAYGLRIKRWFEDGDTAPPLKMLTAVRTGASIAVTFNKNITIDGAATFGTNLNTSLAHATGFEYIDNGSPVQVTNAVALGSDGVTLTLASTPSGAGSQVLRIAMQATSASLVSGASNRSGSQIRRAGYSAASVYDGAFTHYEWATPQEIVVT
jgi:hypothetical protein